MIIEINQRLKSFHGGSAMRMLAIAFLVILLAASGSSFSATLRVPSQYGTIQVALDATSNGDTVLVAPGDYIGAYQMLLKTNVSLLSESGKGATRITGGGISIHGCTGCTIEGFDLNDTPVNISVGSARIMACSIHNTNQYGILSQQQTSTYYHPIIEVVNCDIFQNADGGIWGTGGAENRIMNNRIHDNGGTAIEVCDYFNGTISDNDIHDNNGSGIKLWEGQNVIGGNRILDNTEDGIWIRGVGSPHIQGNTIANNGSIGINLVPWEGSAISPVITRNVIALNGHAGIFALGTCIASVSCNDVWNNGSGNWDYVGFIPDQTGYNGNISADPYFCNAFSGDFSLAANSPALHASCGPMGAILTPGCSNQTAVEHLSWGSIKALYK